MSPYEILGVSQSASKDDIKRAYRRLAVKYHPDRNNGDSSKFMEIQKAYESITNPSTVPVYSSDKFMVVHEDLFRYKTVKVV